MVARNMLRATIPCRTRQHVARASQGCHWQFSGIHYGGAAVIAIRLKNRRRKRRLRSMWVKKWLLNRGAHGAYEHLLQELKVLDVSSYRNFVRMDAATFEELLGMVAPLIIRKDTKMRQSIHPGERLALTLRFLATGWQLSKLLHPRMLCDNQFMQYL